MAEVICVCNGVWEEDLREYRQRYPVSLIDELRAIANDSARQKLDDLFGG